MDGAAFHRGSGRLAYRVLPPSRGQFDLTGAAGTSGSKGLAPRTGAVHPPSPTGPESFALPMVDGQVEYDALTGGTRFVDRYGNLWSKPYA